MGQVIKVGMEIQKIDIIRSKRKTVTIQIKEDGTVCVRAPYVMKNIEIKKLLKEKETWILRNLKNIEEKQVQCENTEKLSREELQQLAELALKVIPDKVQYYAGIMWVSYDKITIRNQKTRWGSCSEKGNLNFNCLLMLVPDEVVNYVVVHELCHLLEMNHSEEFWKQVEQVIPNYKVQKDWLKAHGSDIINRMG